MVLVGSTYKVSGTYWSLVDEKFYSLIVLLPNNFSILTIHTIGSCYKMVSYWFNYKIIQGIDIVEISGTHKQC